MKDTNEYHSPDQDLVVQALRSVKRSILVLDHFTDEGLRPDVEMNAQAMKRRLDTLVERARDGVTYRRFCQVSDPASHLTRRGFTQLSTVSIFWLWRTFVIDRV